MFSLVPCMQHTRVCKHWEVLKPAAAASHATIAHLCTDKVLKAFVELWYERLTYSGALSPIVAIASVSLLFC